MVNIIAALVLFIILALAGLYVYNAKKNGHKCIGCPNGSCPHHCEGCCGSCGETQE